MFPITKAALPFLEISDYWSREIHPPAPPKELLHVLEAAWWLGELRGNSFHSPLQLLKKMFVSMRDQNDLGIIFIVGDHEGPPPIELPDGCVKVDVRQRIPVPSDDPDNWNETTCGAAFGALAEACSRHALPHLECGLPWIELSYEEFTDWLAKRGYAKPTFWRLALRNEVDRGPVGSVATKNQTFLRDCRKAVEAYLAQTKANGQPPTQTGLEKYARSIGLRGGRESLRKGLIDRVGDFARRRGRPPTRNPPKK
jgi:hypothetical protein